MAKEALEDLIKKIVVDAADLQRAIGAVQVKY